jgi:NifU-like protein involved in Fe-S cluster formation
MGAEVLYTPEVLAAAVALADYPLDPALPLVGEARSRSCGSTLTVHLAIGHGGEVTAVGCAARACAVGQAAAAVFLRSAVGRDHESIAADRAGLAQWLGGESPLPDWPGLDLLAPARRFTARHGAILLAWDAALAALGKQAARPATRLG